MTRKLVCTCLVMLAGATAPPFASPANAYFVDGNELLEHCSVAPSGDEFDRTVCLTYIMGAFDAHMFQRTARNDPRCVPQTLSGGQLRELVVEYLRANPENRAMDASALVWNAVLAEWPECGLVSR
jgi:hypothetical protein